MHFFPRVRRNVASRLIVLAHLQHAVSVLPQLVEETVVVGDGVELCVVRGRITVFNVARDCGGVSVGVFVGGSRLGEAAVRGARGDDGRRVRRAGARVTHEVRHELVLGAAVLAFDTGASLGRPGFHVHVLVGGGRHARRFGWSRGPVGGRVAVFGGLVFEAGHCKIPAAGGLVRLAGAATVGVAGELQRLCTGGEVR